MGGGGGRARGGGAGVACCCCASEDASSSSRASTSSAKFSTAAAWRRSRMESAAVARSRGGHSRGSSAFSRERRGGGCRGATAHLEARHPLVVGEAAEVPQGHLLARPPAAQGGGLMARNGTGVGAPCRQKVVTRQRAVLAMQQSFYSACLLQPTLTSCGGVSSCGWRRAAVVHRIASSRSTRVPGMPPHLRGGGLVSRGS